MRARALGLALTMVCAVLLSACGSSTGKPEANTPPPAEAAPAQGSPQAPAPDGIPESTQPMAVEETDMKLLIGDTEVTVQWEDSESVAALRELAADEPLEIAMSMYGGFEQVGPLGTSLPRKDEQTVTEAGDIVLYAGNQIVVFYGSNSWAYTRLGRITDLSAGELAELLGSGDTSLTIMG